MCAFQLKKFNYITNNVPYIEYQMAFIVHNIMLFIRGLLVTVVLLVVSVVEMEYFGVDYMIGVDCVKLPQVTL